MAGPGNRSFRCSSSLKETRPGMGVHNSSLRALTHQVQPVTREELRGMEGNICWQADFRYPATKKKVHLARHLRLARGKR